MSASIKFNPFTGQLDVVNPPPDLDAAQVLKVNRIASEDISALKLVKADSPTNVSKAFLNGTAEDAEVLGLAITAATTGNEVCVLLFGANTDITHAGFALNDPIFLGLDGALTQTPPSTSGQFRTQIGKSLGGNQIFINITEPIELA